MKKLILIAAFSTLPFFAMGQNADSKQEQKQDTTVKTEVAIKKVDAISINPKTQLLDLNFKKSNDIISIKAYIKTLQLKRKVTVTS